MKQVFVDSNVFLRYLTQDDEDQSSRARRLLSRAAAGEVRLITGPPVLFEIVWTLRSAYGQSRERTLEILSSIVAMPGLWMTDGRIVEGAMELARTTGAEFADAYIASSAQTVGSDQIATFDRRHFKRLGADLYSM